MRVVGFWPLFVVALLPIRIVVAFKAPSDVPTWCGKPYMNTDASLDPGGQFQFPTSQAETLLYLTVQPRYTIFLESDGTGSFIVSAPTSHTFGQKYTNISYDAPGSSTGSPFDTLDFEIFSEESGALLVSNSVPVNSTSNLFSFPFTSFTARLTPYSISFYGTSPDGQQTFSTSTQIYILPSRTYGSAVRIDNLYGGLYVQNDENSHKGWYAVFPYGYYADGGTVTPSNFSLSGLQTYTSLGYNSINIVPDGGLPDQSYPVDSLSRYWDYMDSVNLFNLYDMRFAYQNSTRIEEQVNLWMNRSTLLLWYTADEPDGWAYPLNSTKLAYDQLKELDPYHPVSLVLNCQNFFYEEYASGADIVFEDAYPVAINATWSIPWGTPCNETYGDCGCDNCVGELTDVSARLDDIQEYQNSLDGQGAKPTWAVVQVFGAQDYWKSIPSEAEVVNMVMLSINHGAKGITGWIYPSTDDVNSANGALGKVLQQDNVVELLFGGDPIRGLAVDGESLVDASAWMSNGSMMVGIVGGQYVDSTNTLTITLPSRVDAVGSVLYGESGWTVDGNRLSKTGLKALEVDLLMLNI